MPVVRGKEGLMRFSHIVKLGLLVLLMFGAYGVFQFFDIEKLLDPDRLVSALESLGAMGPLVFVGLMVLAVVVSPIPSLPLDIAAGIVLVEEDGGAILDRDSGPSGLRSESAVAGAPKVVEEFLRRSEGKPWRE